MPRAVALLFIAFLALSGAGNVAAQYQTDVNILDLNQIQSGTDNTQNLDIGNASGGGNSKVAIDNVTQTQSGQGNKQTLNVGNAKGGGTNVHISNLTQTQSGSSSTQRLNVGNTGEISDSTTGSGNSSGDGGAELNNNNSSSIPRLPSFPSTSGGSDQTVPNVPRAGGSINRLQEILQDYQVKDDSTVLWQPKGGLGWPPIGSKYEITSTEAKLLDQLGYSRGFLGQKKFSDIKEKAFEDSDNLYPAPSSIPGSIPEDRVQEWIYNDGHRDAFRHAYWNALLTREFGAEWTEQFTTAHEGYPGNPGDREAMDLYNNEVGRQIAIDNPKASPDELADLVRQACNDGKLVVIDPNGGLNWSNQVLYGQHGLTDGVPAEGVQPVPDGGAKVKS